MIKPSQKLAESFRTTAAGFAEFLKTDRTQRLEFGKNSISLGMPYLNDALRGGFRNDLIIVAARTGAGKSEMITHIARDNAEAGKRVHLFALEAAPGEVQRRIKYQRIADFFFRSDLKAQFRGHLNYPDWYYGRLDEHFGKYEAEIDEELTDRYKNLTVHYRTGDFTVDTLAKKLGDVKDDADMILVDHLHYLDIDQSETNENAGLKRVVKKIKDLADLHQKPVILAAHIRKRDRRFPMLLPDIEDIHGSSDIIKIATKIILFGPAPKAFQIPGDATRWPTLIQAAKFREDMSVSNFLALAYFDAARRAYEPAYLLGRHVEQEQDLHFATDRKELPYWAKSAQISQNVVTL